MVYTYALLRDVVLRVLAKAGVEAAAVLPAEEATLGRLVTLQPEVLIVDRSERALVDEALYLGLYADPSIANPKRIVFVDLDENTVEVHTKELVVNASAQDLVDAVQGLSIGDSAHR